MAAGDIDAVHDVRVSAFDDLQRRFGEDPDPEPTLAAAGCGSATCSPPTRAAPGWPSATAGSSAAALAIVREGVWGLSLLVVDPRRSRRAPAASCSARARAHGSGARGSVILSSRDSRALRAYARRARSCTRRSAAATARARSPPRPRCARARSPTSR